MSQSEKSPRPAGTIEIDAPLGTLIEIQDGGFAKVDQGITQLKASLPDGVYTIKLSAADRVTQQAVRLRAGETVRISGEFKSASPSISGKSGVSFEIAAMATEESALATGAEILVIVSAPDEIIRADLTRNIRLRDDSSVKMRRDRDGDRFASGGSAVWAAVRYGINPGNFTLTFETFERRIVEQNIFAPAGRRTIILVHYGQTSIIERLNSDSRLRKRRGIDPSKTLVVSCKHNTAPAELLASFETAEILLHGLRTRARPLDLEVAATLSSPNTDPYLKLYAAAGVLALQGSVMQRLEQAVASETSTDPAANAAATRLAEQLFQFSEWPDVTCLAWRLQSSAIRRQQTMQALPMLEISWRWATAQSVRERNLNILEGNLELNAERFDPSASPWLVTNAWIATSAPLETDSYEDVEPNLLSIADSVSRVLHNETISSPNERSGYEVIRNKFDWSSLSPSTENIVRAIVGTGGAAFWGQKGGELLPQLAASLAIPIATLATKIKGAASELQQIVDQDGTQREDIWNSDPHLKKFGGSPSHGGLTLSLESFDHSDGLEFIALHLAVFSTLEKSEIEGPVTFYLHPTFSPSVQTVRPVDGQASFTCYAWGAFTVGAETSDGKRLELNLAELSELPAWFRAR